MIKKRLIAITLLTVLTVSPLVGNYSTVKAATIKGQTITQAVPQTTLETVPSELIGLDKYITRNSNGTLTLDVSKAIKSGYQNKTVNELAAYLDSLNKLIKSGELVTDNNLNITNKVTTNSDFPATTMAADRGVTVTNSYWWGYNRYISNNNVPKVVSNLNALAITGSTGAGVAAALGAGGLGIAADIILTGYLSLLANRIDAHNVGRGVCVHMTIVGGAYTVVSQ